MQILLEISQNLKVLSIFTTIKRVHVHKKKTRHCKTIDTFIVPHRIQKTSPKSIRRAQIQI